MSRSLFHTRGSQRNRCIPIIRVDPPRSIPRTPKRQPFGKASTRGAVHCSPASSRQRPDRDHRRAQLHQGVPISDVLRGEGSQGPRMYGASDRYRASARQYSDGEKSRSMSSHRPNSVANGTACGRTVGRTPPKRESLATPTLSMARLTPVRQLG